MATNQFLYQGTYGIGGFPNVADAFGFGMITGDFNNDGFSDLAIGALGEDFDSQTRDTGAIHVLLGTKNGVTAAATETLYVLRVPQRFWDIGNGTTFQISHPGPRTIIANTSAGEVFTTGDFDGDKQSDLVTGTPSTYTRRTVPTVAVWQNFNKGWTTNSSKSIHFEGKKPYLGSALAAGDFNGDGKDDLAIGAPGYDSGKGGVYIQNGSKHGLQSKRVDKPTWTQNSPNIHDRTEAGDNFGSALAVGDFNGDKKDDLAIGVSGEDIGSIKDAGAVNVLYGSRRGLTHRNDQLWRQGKNGVKGTAEANDEFGSVLATGDFNGDGKDDLAIGVPNEDLGSIRDAGWVNVLYGSRRGLIEDRDQVWHQNSRGIKGGAEKDDLFGAALAVGDFNGDGKDDLAIGVPGESIGSVQKAGAVNILYGSSKDGLTATNNHWITQNDLGLQDKSEFHDLFGYSLSVGDFNKDGFADLAVGAFGETIAGKTMAGAVNIIFGSANGLNGGG